MDKDGRRLVLAVHGNIGSGKSTLLHAAQATCGSWLAVIPEPIERWCAPYANGVSMLEAFYKDKRRTALAFQMYVLLTQKRWYQEMMRDGTRAQASTVLMERGSWESVDPMSQLMFDEGYMSPVEWAVYKDWRKELRSDLSGLVYLRTAPEQCMGRIKARNRQEETCVDMGYLERVHDVHERMLADLSENHPTVPVLVLDGSKHPKELAAELATWIHQRRHPPTVC
jgi:deoxyadenosine/deoxycytidine kinase